MSRQMTNKRITVYFGDGYWDIYEGWVYYIRVGNGITVFRILENGFHSIIANYEDEDNFYVEEEIL